MGTLAYHRHYNRNRYHRWREDMITELGGKCIKCGSKENLQFDHINPDSKKFGIGHIWSLSKERQYEEIRKCQLLCSKCHRLKTNKELTKKARPLSVMHGTATGYQKFRCRCDSCKAWRRSMS
jgi:5-methylcytosine-specific restriction endonuclease McrA